MRRGLGAAMALAVAGLLGAVRATPAHAAVPPCNSFTSVFNSGDWRSPLPFAHVSSIGSGTGQYNCSMVRGHRGLAVLVLQEALVNCYGQVLVLDGDFGRATRGALMNAQRKINQRYGAGLVVDGEYGPRTRQFFDWAVFDHATDFHMIPGDCVHGIAGG
jgi:hypothetical protein